MISNLYHLLGIPGVLAVAAWVTTPILCAVGLFGGRRGRWLIAAAGVGAVGLLLAEWTTARVNEYRLDRSDEIRVAMEAQRRQLIEEEQLRRQTGEVTVRFVEDAPGEAIGVVVPPAPPTNALPDPSASSAPASTPAANAFSAVSASAEEPEYRKRGKQRRDAGKVDDASASLARRALHTPLAEETGRQLKLDDYRMANRLSRVDLLFARLAFLGALGALVHGYLRRFNRTFECPLHLPIAGAWLDGYSPKSHSVFWTSASDDAVHRFLDCIVRKGESWIYFGDRCAAHAALQRLRLGKFGIWPLAVIACGKEGVPSDAEFLLDAAWFRRNAVCVPRAADTARILTDMARVLAERTRARAKARTTLYLVWDLDAPPPADLLARLPGICRDTNVKFVLAGGAQPAAVAIGFDEVCPAGG